MKSTSNFVVAMNLSAQMRISPRRAGASTWEPMNQSASSTAPADTMAAAPRVPSSAGWKMSFSFPHSSERCAAAQRARTMPSAVWASCRRA
ncbi:hypothetical protein MUN46_000415 [Mesosutterella sp. AGMB02718]|uniref:Uncharacterized protein n=1 Tax=Mesosutterella faecium TaxID=2925194 RepID=A0ABT7IM76_9BURK|nr:hypothetical protein [Mesosutterella sp. AGMB02718]MDL2058427.1 hypothetical protein [Mesosutterella sp. AGMB02718]